MGDPEATAATQLAKPSVSIERRPPTEAVSSSTSTSPLTALRADEIWRVHLFSRLMICLNFMGVFLIQFLGGDPIAKKVFGASLAIAMADYGALYFITHRQERYSERAVAVIAHMCAVPGFGILYYFGVHSPVGMVIALGLYVYSLGSSFRWSLSVLIFMCAIHGALAGLIAFDVIEDRGLIRGERISTLEAVAIQTTVLVLYALGFALARATRRKTLDVIIELEKATRQAAEREALLNEARAELERAHKVGGPGRFTDLTLGSFKLGVVIGRGAMGEVYEATNPRANELVSVKLMHPHAMHDPKHLARFRREVEAVAALSSPNVVRVVEISDEGAPTPYLAMERLHGADLSAYLRDHRRLSPRDVVDLARQVGNGLSAAHDAGIVHRDLKPQNVFRTELAGGSVQWKILDFGVSKLAGASGTLTQDNIVGTPAYMSPEQATGSDVDHRADLYALAAIAYRCITGRPAFSGRDPAELLYKAAHVMPQRPSGLVSTLGRDVDRVFAIALAKRRADRFDTAKELADALADATRGSLDAAVRRRGDRLIAESPWGVDS